jgi:N-acetylmuramic acid 6-phosphate etherase
MTSTDRIKLAAPTEARNPATWHIDTVSTIEVLRLFNEQDARVPAAVAACLPELAVLVDAAAARMASGGRLHYAGAGTSGRIAVMDAAEVPPTFGLPPDAVVAHLAGGANALQYAVEGVEDDEESGRRDLAGIAATDVLVGLAASGRTPYVRGALEVARQAGAFTALVSSNRAAPLAELVDVHVLADTGPEAIAGSTRMKAATAQKLILTSLSTALAVRLGRTYSNLMVDVVASNAKLRGRSVAILEDATGRSEDECVQALREADDEVKPALVSLLAGCHVAEARRRLATVGGRVRDAIR